MTATDTMVGTGPARLRIADLVGHLTVLARRERVTVEDVVSSFGPASFAAMLFVPALVVVSPLSGIPFLPTLAGLLIAMTGAQMALGREHLWLPGPIRRQGVGGARLARALGQISGVVAWLDRTSRDRFHLLVEPPLVRLVSAIAALCGAVMPFLEVFPLTSSFLGLAVVMFSTAFLTRDGLFVLLGLAQIGVAGTILGAVVSAAA